MIKGFKLFLLVGAHLIFLSPTLAQPQPDFLERRYNSIKTNPVPMIWGQIPFTSEFRILFERGNPKSTSYFVGLSYLSASPLNFLFLTGNGVPSVDQIKIAGFRFQAGYKFYLTKKFYGPRGFYTGPFISYSRSTMIFLPQPSEFLEFVYVNYNWIFGYQALAFEKLVIDTFFGMGYKKNNINQVSAFSHNLDVETVEGFKLYLTLNVGYAF